MKLKALALVAAVLMTASCFAACGKTEEQKPVESTPDASSEVVGEESEEEEAGRPTEHQLIEITSTPVDSLDYMDTDHDYSAEAVNLLWYQWGDPAEESDMVYEKLNEMSAADINTTVDYKFADNTKAGLIISTDEYYDMVFTCSWQTNYVENANKGVFAHLEEYLPTAAPTLYNFIPELVWQGATVNGHIDMVPVYKDSAATLVWTIDKDLAESADLADEIAALNADFDSMTPILEILKNETDMEGAPSPYSTTGHSFGYAFDYITRTAHGIGIEDDNGKVISILESNEGKHMAETLSKWYANDLLDKDAITNGAGVWAPVAIAQAWANSEEFLKNVDHGAVVIAEKDPALYTTDYVIGSGHAISVNSDYVERALLFLQWINCNYEARNIFVYGIEGTHWNKTEEGTAQKTEQGLNKYSPSSFSQATFFTTIPEAPKPLNAWDGLLESCQTASATKLLGFTPNNDNIQNELAALNTVWSQYSKNITCGVSQDILADMETALEAMKVAGLQTIIDEYQAQVDEYIG